MPSTAKLRSTPLTYFIPLLSGGFVALLLTAGCFTSKHEIRTEHEVKPIHVTLDVNLKVQQELANAFREQDQRSELLDASHIELNGQQNPRG